MDILLLNAPVEQIACSNISGNMYTYSYQLCGFINCLRPSGYEQFEITLSEAGEINIRNSAYTGFEPFVAKWEKRLTTALSMSSEQDGIDYLLSKGADSVLVQ